MRSHDWISGTSGGGGNSGIVVTGDQIHQQVSTASHVRQNIPATSPSPSPAASLSPFLLMFERKLTKEEKTPQSAAQNGVSLYDLSSSVPSLPPAPAADPMPEPMKVESEAKRRPEDMENKEEVSSPKKECSTKSKEVLVQQFLSNTAF
ncbi:hypothetical protein K7X08_005446 [Anisodus acutangulus]|uniref:Uncharacterized protein n=1 Tax=Anisodus acutangulus TaxID=402998 RepID=A0A9Q1LSE2_9SOLA|nr:hypothetical protein K7X08_005446 [Anisodus acutangulus]